MSRPISGEDVAKLEALIDAHHLDVVLEAIAEICAVKADHVQTNWQDRDLSRVWMAASNRIRTLAAKVWP